MTVYKVQFGDKEFIAHSLRDFARIAVFAKWYLRSQALEDQLHCSMQDYDDQDRARRSMDRALIASNSTYQRRQTLVVRKAWQSLLYAQASQ